MWTLNSKNHRRFMVIITYTDFSNKQICFNEDELTEIVENINSQSKVLSTTFYEIMELDYE